MSVVFRSCRTA